MLGGFELRCGDIIVNESSNRARKLWNLLEYLIAHRSRDVPTEELIEYLWPEDNSDNPLNALKNLVYRLRTIFADAGIPFAKEIIVHTRGLYSWNNELETWVDTEQMELLIQQAEQPGLDDETRVERYMQALALYKGDFLPSSSYENWVVPVSTYYHGLYLKTVKSACALLSRDGRAEAVAELCQNAIMIDQFDEEIHILLVQALVAQNKQQQALEHYEYVSNLFYQELGVKPSEKLRDTYRTIIKGVNHMETDLDVVKEGLREAQKQNGAFVCEYEIFKNIYRLEARGAVRTGKAMFIGMLTLTDNNGNAPNKDLLKRAMEQLLSAICGSLRTSDVVSRFSATQYILLLPTHTYENGLMVLDRINKRFRVENPRLPVKVNPKLQPLDPVL